MTATSDNPLPRGPILLFDGTCNLCRGSVAFIIRHERAPTLRFCPLQSQVAHDLLAAHGTTPSDPESLVLLTDGRALVRSDGAMAVAAHLRLPWRWARLARILPLSWRDRLYDAIARRRHRWFGTSAVDAPLALPRIERDRFLGRG